MEFEKLGAFYLGAEVGADPLEAPLLYDARDLTTHAVCIGMTGSGKTGLCLDLLEEAALDRVPALIIDPKGDMTNLLLTFPELRPEDFAPWVNTDDARRADQTVEDFAAGQAEVWRKGLAGWGQSGERIRTLRDTVDLAVYTPGSDAGIPVSVVSSFAAPAADWSEEAEFLRERISGTVSAILGLVGVDADPVRSREHILLANIFEHFWREDQDLDLARLILSIQDPPVRRLGVFDVDTFFPEKDRMGLAMQLNNLIASPGFRGWLEGQPLDIGGFLSAPDGRPRHSIFYIAHLSEAERMFFVTLLLSQLITWMRQQAGTTSLRALLYMDEVFGFLPPVAEPPSKKPFLTLLKQARAYGLGVVLSTQNPVDIDYKALSNAGTWFVGRLQTERDKLRLLDGLEVAGGEGQSVSRADLDRLISSLDKRQFLLHNVHEPHPLTFNTRWAMSYLRGPLTRGQVSELMAGRDPDELPARTTPPGRAPAEAPGGAHGRAPPGRPSGTSVPDFATMPPGLGSDIAQRFAPTRIGHTGAALAVEQRVGPDVRITGQSLVYRPAVWGAGFVHFLHRASGARTSEGFALAAAPEGGGVRWDRAESLTVSSAEDASAPEPVAVFEPLPEAINQARELTSARKDLADYLYRSRQITLRHAPDLGAFSRPDESIADFRLRLEHEARERRDAEIDRIEDRYQVKIDRLGERIRRAASAVDKREAEASAHKRETVAAIGETVLGAFLGRRSSRSASSSLRRVRMSSSAGARAREAEDNLEALERDRVELEAEFQTEIAGIRETWDVGALDLEEVAVTPRRTDIDVQSFGLIWLPIRRVSYEQEGRPAEVDIPAY